MHTIFHQLRTKRVLLWPRNNFSFFLIAFVVVISRHLYSLVLLGAWRAVALVCRSIGSLPYLTKFSP